MDSLFIDKFKSYRKSCDDFFENGKCREFFKKYNIENAAGRYLDALVKHSVGGKRIRAFLVYLGYCIYAGFDKGENVFLPSLSYELFQTGILAHDDIIDNSDLRRHKPSMHIDLGGGHMGLSKSICVGDFGIIFANDILLQQGFDVQTSINAVGHQNKVFASTVAGELMDIELSETKNAELCDILEMYRLKTAQYTVSGPLMLGAILAGVKQDEIELLSYFGDNVGIAFQIKDDILGIFGDTENIGKTNFSDMCEGKQTVLTAHFYRNATQQYSENFSAVYGNAKSGEEQLQLVREMLKSTGSLEFADNLCYEYTRKAKDVLDKLSISESSKDLLQGLLTYMTSRNS